MLVELNVSLYITLSIISFMFSVICVFALLKIFKANKIPYQLEWLAQAIVLFAICQVYTFVKFSCFSSSKIILYREVFYWVTYLIIIYLCLYSTKFVTKKCEFISKLFTFISHMALGMSTIYLFMSIFIIKMGFWYAPQSLNIYTWLYKFKPAVFLIETSILLIYNLYTWKSLNYKKHVNAIKWTLQFCMAIFTASYFIYPLTTVFFIFFEVLLFIVITLIMYNVFHERGRFLND